MLVLCDRGWWILSKDFRPLALTVLEWRHVEDIFTMDNSVFNECMSDEGVCRTAHATPGLLSILIWLRFFKGFSKYIIKTIFYLCYYEQRFFL